MTLGLLSLGTTKHPCCATSAVLDERDAGFHLCVLLAD